MGIGDETTKLIWRKRVYKNVVALILLLSSLAHAQNPPVAILDEGSSQGVPVFNLDCVGSGIACTHSGTTGTITVSGGGSDTFTNIDEDGVDQSTGAPTLDFDSSDFTIVESPTDDFDITINNGGITITESQISDLQSYLTSESNDLSSVVTWDDVPDANITESSVTQHEAALTITESQISDLSHTTDTNLTEEEVEDFIGAGMSGNTETRITVTYQDADGTFDFVVDDMNDDVPESGDFGNADDLEASGELSADVVDQSKIADNAIQEEHLKAVDTASDEECLTYESTTGDFEWQTCGGGGGASELSDLSDVNTSTATNRNVLVADGVDWESRALVEADISDLGSYLTSESNDLSSSVTWTNVPDANITEGSVTQHESALTITESQISDLDHTATDITAGIITEGDLNTDNTAVDGDILVYDSTGANFEWLTCAEITGSADLCDGGDADTNTNANTECSGTTTYLDGEGNCDDISSVYAASSHTHTESDITDLGNYLESVDISANTNLAAGRSLTLSGDSVIADSELYTHKLGAIAFEDPTDADDFDGFAYAFQNFTITGIYCKTDTGTVNLDIQIDDGSAADVNGSDITCTSSGVTDTSLGGDTNFDSGDQLDLEIASVASSPGVLFIVVWGTADD